MGDRSRWPRQVNLAPFIVTLTFQQYRAAAVNGLASRQHPLGSTAVYQRLAREQQRCWGIPSFEAVGKLAPPHSMTSSARASSELGKVRPSAFAVPRLIT